MRFIYCSGRLCGGHIFILDGNMDRLIGHETRVDIVLCGPNLLSIRQPVQKIIEISGNRFSAAADAQAYHLHLKRDCIHCISQPSRWLSALYSRRLFCEAFWLLF